MVTVNLSDLQRPRQHREGRRRSHKFRGNALAVDVLSHGYPLPDGDWRINLVGERAQFMYGVRLIEQGARNVRKLDHVTHSKSSRP